MLEIIDLCEADKLHLQRIADRLNDVEQRLSQASGEKETVKDDLWPLFDSLGGVDSHVIYESLDPNLGQRLAREISWRREFDVEGLKTVLSRAAFAEVTKTVINLQALDLSLALGRIDPELVRRYMTLTPTLRGPIWKKSGGKIHLQPGQLAIVRSDDGDE